MASAMRKMAVYLGLVEDDHRYQDKTTPTVSTRTTTIRRTGLSRPTRSMRSVGVKRDGEVSAGYVGYQAADWRTEHVSQTTDLARITTLHPRTYNEARTIGEHFREGTPVIMNLTEMVDSDAKRLVDFAAGLIFGLRGSIERVTNKVFLLSPANVEVTAEDKARIAERGFFNQS